DPAPTSGLRLAPARSEAWIPATVEPSHRREREERPEELTDLVGRPELGDEARAPSFDLKRVRLPNRHGDRLACDQLRTERRSPELISDAQGCLRRNTAPQPETTPGTMHPPRRATAARRAGAPSAREALLPVFHGGPRSCPRGPAGSSRVAGCGR